MRHNRWLWAPWVPLLLLVGFLAVLVLGSYLHHDREHVRHLYCRYGPDGAETDYFLIRHGDSVVYVHCAVRHDG